MELRRAMEAASDREALEAEHGRLLKDIVATNAQLREGSGKLSKRE